MRTSLLYGLEKMDRGTEWVVQAIRRGEPVTLFTDQFRNPILVTALAAALLELAEHTYTGILHVAGAQRVSRADYTLRLLRWWGVEPGKHVTLGPSDGDRWPLDTTLDISRAQALLKTPLPELTHCSFKCQSPDNAPLTQYLHHSVTIMRLIGGQWMVVDLRPLIMLDCTFVSGRSCSHIFGSLRGANPSLRRKRTEIYE